MTTAGRPQNRAARMQLVQRRDLAGHAVSLALEASVEYVQHTVRDEDQEGPTYESTLAFSGDTLIEVEITELEE